MTGFFAGVMDTLNTKQIPRLATKKNGSCSRWAERGAK